MKFFDQDGHYLSCEDLSNEELIRRTDADGTTSVCYDCYIQYEEPEETESVTQSLSFLAEVAEVTPVSLPDLVEITPYGTSTAQKSSWVAERGTKRGQDIAYCILGLLDVDMPLLDGEGRTKAFFRLQEEPLEKSNNDSDLFAWDNPDLWTSGLVTSSPHV